MMSTASLRDRVGQEIGVSDWLNVDQGLVDRFAAATGDDYWIHTDVKRASAGPLNGTIAHGFLTLSLAAGFLADAVPLEEFPCVLNYGLDRVRFTAPLPVGEAVRLRARLDDVCAGPAALTLRVGLTFETPSGAKPVCVATWLLRAYPGDRG